MPNPIAEAWSSGRPIFNRTPGLNEGYTGNELVDWLTTYFDEIFIQSRETVEDIPVRQLNPLLCNPNWLDFLAPLYGWDSLYWNTAWPIQSKRTLLSNSYSGISIWENKGTLETLSFVLSAVGIRNYIRIDGDFIIGESVVGDEIGSQPWEFEVSLPPSYEGTDKYRECLNLVEMFGPCYCERSIIFDFNRFIQYEVLSTESDELISSNTNEVLQVGENDGT